MSNSLTVVPITMVLGFCCLQAQQADPVLQFEVASLHKTAPNGGSRGMTGGPGTSTPGLITFTGFTLRDLIFRAFTVQAYELTTPDWMSTDRYDIVARVPLVARKGDVPVMLQALLRDRFGLTVHREASEKRGFVLELGSGSPRFTTTTSDAPPQESDTKPQLGFDKRGFFTLPAGYTNILTVPGTDGISRMTAGRTTMQEFCTWLSRQLQQPVEDNTALPGQYDFRLYFASEVSRDPALDPPRDAPDAATDPAPTLPKAVEQQLGLKLTPKRVTVNMLVIDHALRVPTEN